MASRRVRLFALFLLLGAGGVAVGAPAVGAQVDPTVSPPTDAPTTDSPPTVPPTDAPATTAGSASDSDDSGLDDGTGSNTDWEVIAAIALAVVFVIGLLAVLASVLRPKESTTRSRPAPRTGGDVARLAGQAQWVHDSVCLQVLAGDRESLPGFWVQARREIATLGGSIAGSAGAYGQAPVAAGLRSLGQALSGLTNALETHVALRTRSSSEQADAAGVAAAMQESSEVVARRRAELEKSIQWLSSAAAG